MHSQSHTILWHRRHLLQVSLAGSPPLLVRRRLLKLLIQRRCLVELPHGTQWTLTLEGWTLWPLLIARRVHGMRWGRIYLILRTLDFFLLMGGDTAFTILSVLAVLRWNGMCWVDRMRTRCVYLPASISFHLSVLRRPVAHVGEMPCNMHVHSHACTCVCTHWHGWACAHVYWHACTCTCTGMHVCTQPYLIPIHRVNAHIWSRQNSTRLCQEAPMEIKNNFYHYRSTGESPHTHIEVFLLSSFNMAKLLLSLSEREFNLLSPSNSRMIVNCFSWGQSAQRNGPCYICLCLHWQIPWQSARQSLTEDTPLTGHTPHWTATYILPKALFCFYFLLHLIVKRTPRKDGNTL